MHFVAKSEGYWAEFRKIIEAGRVAGGHDRSNLIKSPQPFSNGGIAALPSLSLPRRQAPFSLPSAVSSGRTELKVEDRAGSEVLEGLAMTFRHSLFGPAFFNLCSDFYCN